MHAPHTPTKTGTSRFEVAHLSSICGSNLRTRTLGRWRNNKLSVSCPTWLPETFLWVMSYNRTWQANFMLRTKSGFGGCIFKPIWKETKMTRKWPLHTKMADFLCHYGQKTFWCAYSRHAICLPSFLLPSETGWVGWILKHFWEPDSKKMRLKQSLGSKMWLFRKDIFRLFFCGSTHDRQAEHISCCSVKLISEPGFLIRILEGTAEPKWPIWPKIAFYVFSGMPFGDFYFFFVGLPTHDRQVYQVSCS